MFAKLIGKVSKREMGLLADLAANAEWRHRSLPDREFYTAQVQFWEPCDRAFFLKIPPNGFIHRHKDEAIQARVEHLVLTTNDQCENCWLDGTEQSIHMKQGYRYEVRNQHIEHWAFNRGETDRIHLIVEFK